MMVVVVGAFDGLCRLLTVDCWFMRTLSVHSQLASEGKGTKAWDLHKSHRLDFSSDWHAKRMVLIDNHHGTVHVQSEKGKGSMFTVKIPLI